MDFYMIIRFGSARTFPHHIHTARGKSLELETVEGIALGCLRLGLAAPYAGNRLAPYERHDRTRRPPA